MRASEYVEKSFGKNIKTYITDISTEELDRMIDNQEPIPDASDSLILTGLTSLTQVQGSNISNIDGVFTLYYCDCEGQLHRLTYPIQDKGMLEVIATSLNDLNSRIKRLEQKLP